MNNTTQRRRRVRKNRSHKAQISRILLAVCMMALVAVVSIGGTIAWLVSSTTTVTNEFTTSDVTVTLEESEELDLQMVPGKTITKDPKVTLTEGSEDSYVFVKLEKVNNFDSYMTYTMADDWTALTGVDGVYYYTGEITKGTPIPVIKDNKITVSTELTKADMTTAAANKPQLQVTAYACQKANVADAATAWSYINNSGKTPVVTE